MDRLLNKRLAIVSLVVLGLLGILWVYVNPGSGSGLSQCGVTTYCRVPVPGIDFQVRPDGGVRWVHKTHDLNRDTGRIRCRLLP